MRYYYKLDLVNKTYTYIDKAFAPLDGTLTEHIPSITYGNNSYFFLNRDILNREIIKFELSTSTLKFYDFFPYYGEIDQFNEIHLSEGDIFNPIALKILVMSKTQVIEVNFDLSQTNYQKTWIPYFISTSNDTSYPPDDSQAQVFKYAGGHCVMQSNSFKRFEICKDYGMPTN